MSSKGLVGVGSVTLVVDIEIERRQVKMVK